MKKIVLIDNYDSFTFNLYQYVLMQATGSGVELEVIRNDVISVDSLQEDLPAGIIISPGPGKPENAGHTCRCIEYALKHKIPILGVCLGHQALAEVLGGSIVPAPTPLHGYTSQIIHDGSGLFRGLPDRFPGMRYHSLMVDGSSLPATLTISACAADDQVIMGLRAHSDRAWGVQFHPESFLTVGGHQLISNFLSEVTNAHCASHQAA